MNKITFLATGVVDVSPWGEEMGVSSRYSTVVEQAVISMQRQAPIPASSLFRLNGFIFGIFPVLSVSIQLGRTDLVASPL